MKKIKVLYGLEAGGGGALKHLSYLVCNLDKALLDVTVAVSPVRSAVECHAETEKMRASGAEVILLPMAKQISPWSDLAALVRIYRLLGRSRYDVVHAHSSKAGVLFRIAAWLRNVPMILYTPHCFYFQAHTSFGQKYFYLGVELLLAAVTHRIIVSDSEKKALRAHSLFPAGKALVINNAIKFSGPSVPQRTACIRQELGVPPAHFVVGSVGRLEPQKDWDTYLRAAHLVVQRRPDTTFLIVGSGSEEDKIRNAVRELGLGDHVRVTGYLPQTERIYAMMNIFVSTTRWEGLPYVFLEAMRHRKPIVTTAHGNDSVVLHNKTGLVLPCRDHHSIAESIVQLIDNQERVVALGNNGYRHLTEHFRFDVFMEKHQSLYLAARTSGREMTAPGSQVIG